MKRFLLTVVLSTAPAFAQIANIVVTSAADYSVGLPASGSAASLFCTGLDLQGVTAPGAAPLPYTLAGVQVAVGGKAAPLYAVASLGLYQQVNFEVPADVQSDSGTTVIAVTQGVASGSASALLNTEFAGQLYQLPPAIGGGGNIGVFQRVPDYSLITQANPAHAGDVLVAYINGLPYLQPLPADGTVALANPVTAVTPPAGPGLGSIAFQLGFDGTFDGPAPAFLGLSPGAVGLGQVNFTVPLLTPGMHLFALATISCGAFDPLCALRSTNTVQLPVE